MRRAAQEGRLRCRKRGHRRGALRQTKTEAIALEAVPPAAGTPGSIGRSNALFTRWFDMHLSSTSAPGVRFLTSVREGRGLKRSAREAGIGKETGYRWLREAYVAHRRGGKSIAETEAVTTSTAGTSRSRRPDTGASCWSSTDPPSCSRPALRCSGVGRPRAQPLISIRVLGRRGRATATRWSPPW